MNKIKVLSLATIVASVGLLAGCTDNLNGTSNADINSNGTLDTNNNSTTTDNQSGDDANVGGGVNVNSEIDAMDRELENSNGDFDDDFNVNN